MAQTDIPDAQAKIDARDKGVPWYHPDISNRIGDSIREVFENYGKVPASEVQEHVYKICELLFANSSTMNSLLTGDNSATRLGPSGHTHALEAGDFSICTSDLISPSCFSPSFKLCRTPFLVSAPGNS